MYVCNMCLITLRFHVPQMSVLMLVCLYTYTCHRESQHVQFKFLYMCVHLQHTHIYMYVCMYVNVLLHRCICLSYWRCLFWVLACVWVHACVCCVSVYVFVCAFIIVYIQTNQVPTWSSPPPNPALSSPLQVRHC